MCWTKERSLPSINDLVCVFLLLFEIGFEYDQWNDGIAAFFSVMVFAQNLLPLILFGLPMICICIFPFYFGRLLSTSIWVLSMCIKKVWYTFKLVDGWTAFSPFFFSQNKNHKCNISNSVNFFLCWKVVVSEF